MGEKVKIQERILRPSKVTIQNIKEVIEVYKKKQNLGTSIGEDVDPHQQLCTIGRSVNKHNHMEKNTCQRVHARHSPVHM